MMFDEGPHDAGRAFGPQRQPAAAAVFEDVHFFLHDVGGFAEGPLKKIERFKRGRADFVEPKAGELPARRIFKRLKERRVGAQNVFGSTDRLEFNHGRNYRTMTAPASA